MKVAQRSNLLWGFVLLALALFVLAYAVGLVPLSIWDAALRAAPALLVLAGLSLLFRGRIPLSGLLSLLLPALDPSSGITGEFIGSLESDFDVSYEVAADNSATLRIRESRENTLPMLEQMGRGTLNLELPSGIPLDVQFVGQSGDAVLNMNGLNLERVNADLAQGDLVATLPDYAPLLTERGELLGTLDAQNGALTLFVPPRLSSRRQQH
jgi:hypothetical protein